MKVLYFSCHAILEFDEVKLFKEIGLDIFSAGAYSYPLGHPSLPRPGIPELTHYPELERAASTIRSTGGVFPQELIDWADVIIFMHEPEILEKNWERLKSKKVIFRSIGQCVSHQEVLLKKMADEGLRIVRYSPKEDMIPGFAGGHAVIRFYKDPLEFNSWNGKKEEVINVSQSLKQRKDFCFYNEIIESMVGFNGKVYGTSNEDLNGLWGGVLSYDELKGLLRDSRVYLYGGTIPAAYTLSFIEAFMTGIPIVAIGPGITKKKFIHFSYYEVDSLIENEVTGFIGNTIDELRKYIQLLLNDYTVAQGISAKAQIKAGEIFGKKRIKQDWVDFLQKI